MRYATRYATAAVLTTLSAMALPAAAENAPAPPYLMTDANTVTIAVTWKAESLTGLLPAGVTPAEDLSGGLNVYDAEAGYGLTPYSAAYAYVNLAGWDSASGAPARHILGGWYGPDPKVAAAMRTHFGAAVATGDAGQTEDGDLWTGTGGDGAGTIELVVRPSGDCVAGGGTLNYVAEAGGGAGLGLLQIPFTGDYCMAEPVSVEISGPEGSALAQIEVDEMLAGGRLRNGAFTFTK
ncbi:hypothetical protein [Rhodosalinus sp.]|uniref:hypothetical protein n=1 Tax=Rhodosalinus sp. TaxID=2047741 RepID=UPI0035678930